MNDLTVQNGTSLTVSAEQLSLIKQTIAADATDAELELFLYDNKRRGVHPLDRLIHFTKRKGKYVPITSIHFMRAKADEEGRAGQDKPIFSGVPRTKDYTCEVTVYKIVGGQKVSYTGTAKWGEYYPGDNEQGFMWRKMETHMMAKCAEANALRLGFPRALAGLHIAEEAHLFERPEAAEVAERPSLKEKLKAKFDEPLAVSTDTEPSASPSTPLIQERSSEEASTPQDGSTYDSGGSPKAQLEAGQVCHQFLSCDSVAEWARIMNAWMSESYLYPEEERVKVKQAADAAKKRLGRK